MKLVLRSLLVVFGCCLTIWLIPEPVAKPSPKPKVLTEGTNLGPGSYQFNTPEGPMTIVVGDDVENVNIIDSKQ